MKADSANKLLVIEDNGPLLADIVEMLTLEGFDIRSAENGKAGLEVIEADPPDLIICDVGMPVMDGYSLLDHLRSTPQTASIPFIFLTARTSREDMRTGMQLGADDYLMKPFTARELLDAVNARLERSENAKRQTREEMDQLRQNILLALPHEMRTPLNAILGFSQLMMSDANSLKPEQVYEMARNIHESSQRLFHLTENYISYAILEVLGSEPERAKELRQGRVEFPLVTVEQVARMKADEHKRQSDLVIDLEPLAVSLSIDREYLARIVEELVDNAFKFSDRGSPVTVSVGQVDGPLLNITIADEGCGMSPTEIQSIGAYMQFRRAILEQQGVGFGMTIAKRLVELHGGQWAIESELSVYTHVRFGLPIATT